MYSNYFVFNTFCLSTNSIELKKKKPSGLYEAGGYTIPEFYIPQDEKKKIMRRKNFFLKIEISANIFVSLFSKNLLFMTLLTCGDQNAKKKGGNKDRTFKNASVHFQLVYNMAAIKQKEKKFDRFIEIRTRVRNRTKKKR